ncbi:MAG: hypothetical protein UX74_C0005G0028 [Parcubacteria group bacterium GW2011_GWA2_47_10b]|nr:MAG: hypothetical protein UX74_C0005G0028 [Parcubacteria group bacterium GW2011_GWA2_47_10b]
MKASNQLKNNYVLITGASSGIGFQIAKDFLSEGALAGVHYCRNKKGIEKLRKCAKPGQCRIFQADFSRSEEVLRLWDEFILWSKNRIDVLVNNAGEVGERIPLRELSEEAWDMAFQVNVKAPFLLSRAALSVMSKQRSGRIINISSIGVKFGGSPTTAHYSASKAALEAMTGSFAKAAAPFNVLVNVVRAGVTDTPLHTKTSRRDLSRRTAMIPLKRLARPAEISNVVIFLAGKKSSFITKAIIDVAGGE